ncbi:MAG: hypothetical protein KIG47_09350, partial [Prevotellamassilia sp.]|nr:hypothetical protein [Prevotellamassilia sp.]
MRVSARRAEWQEKLVFIDIPEPPPNLRRKRELVQMRAEWQEKLVLGAIGKTVLVEKTKKLHHSSLPA